MEIARDFFENNYKQTYEVFYHTDDDSLLSNECVTKIFDDGRGYNVYYVFFVLLLFMKSLRSKLRPRDFLEFRQISNLK